MPALLDVSGLRLALPDLARKPPIGPAPLREILKGVDLSLDAGQALGVVCLLYTSPSPRDQRGSRMPSSA